MQQISIIGHLGSDPEIRYTTSGTAVANFNVATSEKWKDAQGNKQERTIWFTVTAWKAKAELVSQYLNKGSCVHIFGKMEEPVPWIDGKTNEARCRLKMTMTDITFLPSGGTRQDNGANKNAGGNNQQDQEYNGPSDEDIPF